MAILFSSCQTTGTHRDDLLKYFTQQGVTGCFEMLDNNKNAFTDVNSDRCSQRFIPASTFKILNSLIALQTGAATSEHMVLKWDSIDRKNPLWNQDQDMTTAFRNSTVWYYQELARRIGKDRMQEYLNEVHYGNAIMGGAIDSFWLTGQLRISCDEQIEFLANFVNGQLPFSKQNMDRVKAMMLREDTLGYRLYYKSGWGKQNGDNIGWLVGFIEKNNDTYIFATNIESAEPAPAHFADSRLAITKSIFHELGLM